MLRALYWLAVVTMALAFALVLAAAVVGSVP